MTPWAEKKVGDLIDGLVAGISVRSRDGDLSRPAVLKTSAVANGRVDFRETKAIIAADVSRAKCAPVRDSIVISRMNTPALVGAVGYVETDEPGVFLPDRLWIARGKRSASTDMRWLNYALGFGDVANSVRELATGTSNSMKNIPKSRLLELSLLVPSPEEQRAISTALFDVDSLIASLEGLIAKKRNIKQGLMQELLKGRTRLSGFSTDWADVAFNDVARPVSERTMPMSSRGRVIELEHLGAGTGRLLGDSDLHDSISLKTRFKTGDVLFGKLRSYLRKFWLADVDGFCSTEIWALRPASGTASSFLRYLVETEEFIEAASTAYGTHMPRADWNVVSRLEVSLPPLDEQHAIAKVLLDTDAEIFALERRLTSTRAIKQGMMQELLTGRTRLVAEAAA